MVPPYIEQGVDRQVEHHVTGGLDVEQILGRGEEEFAEVARGDKELAGGNISLQNGRKSHDEAGEIQLTV